MVAKSGGGSAHRVFLHLPRRVGTFVVASLAAGAALIVAGAPAASAATPGDHSHDPSGEDHCADTAGDLLECLGVKGHGAEKVRIRTIGVDIELDDC